MKSDAKCHSGSTGFFRELGTRCGQGLSGVSPHCQLGGVTGWSARRVCGQSSYWRLHVGLVPWALMVLPLSRYTCLMLCDWKLAKASWVRFSCQTSMLSLSVAPFSSTSLVHTTENG